MRNMSESREGAFLKKKFPQPVLMEVMEEVINRRILDIQILMTQILQERDILSYPKQPKSFEK